MSRAFIVLLAVTLAACSGSKKQSTVFPAGEKVTVGPLTYTVVDTQVLTQLGDDPTTARDPQNRFYLVTLSVSNSSTDDVPIPGLTLVSDSGKEYQELADGTNVPKWLGVVRQVGGTQTEQGNIVFDAPAAHYRLRLTDETDNKQLYADIPLNFMHEQVNHLGDSAAPPDQVIQLPTKK